jgi:uncharacterized protein
MKNEQEKTLKQKEIAVIGVSEQEEKYGYKIFRDLIINGYNVKGINIHGGAILGRKMYKSLEELESLPDIIITTVKPQVTEKIVETAIQLGIKEIWMQPGSESESAVKKARDSGIKVTYNSCLMLDNKIW